MRRRKESVNSSYVADDLSQDYRFSRIALWKGYEKVKKTDILTTNMIIDIQQMIERNKGCIRKLPGTVLKND
jgi:hypothetical protein